MPQAIAPIFASIGTLLTSTVAPGFFARTIAMIGLNILSAKLLQPKQPKVGLTPISVTTTGTLDFRKIAYGRVYVSGPTVYKNLSGAQNQYLWHQVAMLHGTAYDLVEVRLDGDSIPKADIAWTAGTGASDGTGSGNVSTAKWVNSALSPDVHAVQIYYYLGDVDQPVSGNLDSAFADIDTNNRLREVAHVIGKFYYNEDTARIWELGAPQTIGAVWDARLVYDRRKDALNADPDFATYGDPVGQGLKWFGDEDQSAVISGADNVTASAGILTVEDDDTATVTIFSERIAVDSAKRYQFSVDIRNSTGDRNARLGVAFFDVNGNNILASGDSATGWGAKGTYFLEAPLFTPTASFVAHSIDFGVGGTAQFPQDTTAVDMCIVMLLVSGGTTDTDQEVRDATIHEYVATRHDFTDDSTWQWSDNPANCYADYLTQIMGVAYDRIDWMNIVDVAQFCDELVDIPPVASPQTQEKRFTCNGVISLGVPHRENLRDILSSCDGRFGYRGGLWSIRGSTWQAPTLTISDSDVIGDVNVRGSAPQDERHNLVRGFFYDPDRDYEAVEFNHVTAAAYVTRDNGKTLPVDIELPMTNSNYMAQRIGFRIMERGNRQKIASWRMGARGARVLIGDVVTLEWTPLDWVTGGNLLTRSEEFDHTDWTSVNSNETADAAISPFGTDDADALNEDGSLATTHYIQQGFSGQDDTVYTVSVYAKAANRSWVRLQLNSRTNAAQYANFDLENGVIGTTLNIVDAGIESSVFGWHRIWVTADIGSGGTAEKMLLAIAEGDNDVTFDGLSQASVYLFGAQMEQQRSPTPYKRTTSATVTTAPLTARVVESAFNGDGTFNITAVEDDSAAYDDPLVAEYGTKAGPAITIPSDVIPAPSNLAGTGETGGHRLTWTLPPAGTYDFIYVYQGTSNSFSGSPAPSVVARVQADSVFIPTDSGVTRYYWIRAVKEPDGLSSVVPDNSPDTGVTVTADTVPSQPVTAIGTDLNQVSIDPADAEAKYRSDSDGDVYYATGDDDVTNNTSQGTWLQEGAAGDYDVGLWDIVGDAPTSGPAVDAWHRNDVDREWEWLETNLAGTGVVGSGTIKYKRRSDGQIVSQAALTWSVDVDT